MGTTAYFKYSVRQIVTEEKLNQIIKEINSAPTISRSFKDTYSKVYPDVFKDDFNTTLKNEILGNEQEQCPSRQVANQYWWLIGDTKFEMNRKLLYAGLVWTLEDNVTQEKCFEYYMSHFDFTSNAKGINQSSLMFYNKSLDSLTVDEQLGIILLIKNPAYFNRQRFPDRYDKALERLKEKITGHNSG